MKKTLLIGLISMVVVGVVTWNTQAIFAVSVVNSSNSGAKTSSPIDLTKTISSGSNKLLLVGVSVRPSTDSVSSVTWRSSCDNSSGSQSLSIVSGATAYVNGQNARTEIWQLKSPTARTSGHICVTLSSDPDKVIVGATDFTDVDQTTSISNSNNASGNGSPASILVTSSSGNLVFGVLGFHDNSTATDSQTNQWNVHSDSPHQFGAVGSTKSSGSTSTTLNWSSFGNGEWAASAVEVKNVVANGTIIVKKTMVGGTGSFSFTGSPSGTISVNNGTISTSTVPGTYTSTETLVSGWDLSSVSCDNASSTGSVANHNATFNIASNATTTCTFTNTKLPKLTVTKVVVNNNGGTKVVADFPLKVDGGTVTSGVQNTFSVGTHSVSEVNSSGYSTSFSGSCDSQGSITLSAGDVKSCTITNDDQPTTLTVVKYVVNDNGGTATSSDFTINVTNSSSTPSSFSGSNQGTVVILTPGSYSVSEDQNQGYTPSYSQDCSGTTIAGDTKTCTIINDDIQPKITVTKLVTNDNGGTATVESFGLKVGQTSVTSGVQAGINAGAYIVSETGSDGYVASFSGDCDSQGNITLNIGDVKNCTVTNDDIQPKLTVTKIVNNNDGGQSVVGDFTLRVDGSQVTSGVQLGYMAGTSYTVSEDNPGLGYVETIGGDCSANGSITLYPGDVKTCTITNDDIAPGLTVIKQVINNNGGTAVVGNFNLFVGETPVTSGQSNNLSAGDYIVSESGGPSGYLASFSGDCDSQGNVTLGVGDTKICTITNDDIQPKLTVTKVVVNDNGGTAQVSNFPLFVGDVSVTSGQQDNFNSGVYAVHETNQQGYQATFSGDCDSQGNISLNIGDVKTCTVTNDDIAPSLTLVKQVNNEEGGEASPSSWTLTADGPTPISGQGGVQSGSNFSAGTYTLSESEQLANYSTSNWSCQGVENQGNSVVLGLGQIATCIITNTYHRTPPPKLTVTKVVVNGNNGTKVVADFPLFVGEQSVISGEQNSFEPGTYTVSETRDSNYTATFSGDCNENGSIALQLDDEKTCTVTNTYNVAPYQSGSSIILVPEDTLALCSDNNDNDRNGLTDLADPNCAPFLPVVLGTSTSTVEETSTSTVGEVLGTSTECLPPINQYLYFGGNNDPAEVTKLQEFLNSSMGANLTVNGIFDLPTLKAVKDFQLRFKVLLLRPWLKYGHPDENIPTGNVFKLTRWLINVLRCPSSGQLMPTLP